MDGIYLHYSNCTITNSIIWNNDDVELYIDDNSSVNATYSNIQGGYIGMGNIDTDPIFVDAANGDYHLQESSLCIGAGDSTYISSTDIEGNPRPNPAGSITDMGAYEHENATPTDLAPPTISSISSSSASGTYGIGDTVIISINFYYVICDF